MVDKILLLLLKIQGILSNKVKDPKITITNINNNNNLKTIHTEKVVDLITTTEDEEFITQFPIMPTINLHQ